VPEWLSSFEARPPVGKAQIIKVMTHNIFGLNYDMDRVAKVIAEENPDIVALQEYFPEQEGLDALLKPNYPYRVVCRGGKRANIGLYSKIAFDREMSDADCPDNAYGTQRTAHIIAGFTLADGTHFSLMTTHMDWPFPIERQREEYLSTEAAVQAVQGPLLLVGDFNSTPWSYVMKAFESETGLKRETRNLITYPELFTVPSGLIHTWPFLALDQVFERGVAVHELHRGPETGSDHLPVIFSFSVGKGEASSE
jgi:endonuclease/exonuclease/phosphatase (EEP) superfamily protein YafD